MFILPQQWSVKFHNKAYYNVLKKRMHSTEDKQFRYILFVLNFYDHNNSMVNKFESHITRVIQTRRPLDVIKYFF